MVTILWLYYFVFGRNFYCISWTSEMVRIYSITYLNPSSVRRHGGFFVGGGGGGVFGDWISSSGFHFRSLSVLQSLADLQVLPANSPVGLCNLESAFEDASVVTDEFYCLGHKGIWVVSLRVLFAYKTFRIMKGNAPNPFPAVYFVHFSSFFCKSKLIFESSSLLVPGAGTYCTHQGLF